MGGCTSLVKTGIVHRGYELDFNFIKHWSDLVWSTAGCSGHHILARCVIALEGVQRRLTRLLLGMIIYPRIREEAGSVLPGEEEVKREVYIMRCTERVDYNKLFPISEVKDIR